jgi:hypothetical protein
MTVTIEYLTDKRVYAYLAGAWVDLTTDVYVPDKIRCTWGMSGNTPLDRIAQTGTMYFTLVNTSKKYSPDTTSALAGWKKGVPVKLVVSYDGLDYVRWYGVVDGLTIDAGTKSNRRCFVSCVDWMDYAAKYPLVNPGLLQNKTADQGLTTLVAGMPIQPKATSYDTGVTNFKTLFDTVTTKTKAYTEFTKLSLSEVGYIYLRKDRVNGETLVFDGNHKRNGLNTLTPIPLSNKDSGFLLMETGDHLLLETGDKILLDQTQTVSIDNTMVDMTIEYGRNIVNRVTAIASPKRVDTSNQVLWALSSPLLLGSGVTTTFRAGYSDPTGGAIVNAMPGTMVAPVSGTDYAMFQNADGTGTNYTANLTIVAVYGTEGVTYTLTNTSDTSAWITLLQARGFGVYSYNPTESSQEDSASFNEFGYQSLTINQVYQQTPDVGIMEGAKILEREKQPRSVLQKIIMIANKSTTSMEAFLNIDVGDLVYIKEDQTGTDGYYYIQGLEFTISDERIITFSWIVKQSFSLSNGLSLAHAVANSADQTIDYGYLPTIANFVSKSYSAWVRTNDDGVSVFFGDIIGAFGVSSGNKGFRLFISNVNLKLSYLEGGNSDINYGYWQVNSDFPVDNAWHFVTVTRDSTLNANLPKIFIDGSVVAITQANAQVGANDETGFPLILGSFVGDILDVRKYNRILSAAEVASMYAGGPGETNVLSGLIFQGPVTRNTKTIERNNVLENIYGNIGKSNGSPTLPMLGMGKFDNYTSSSGNLVSSVTWAHTVLGGSNRLLVVSVARRAFVAISSITYGGVALTKLTSVQAGSGNFPQAELWYLVAPAIGTANVVLTLASSTDVIAVSAMSMRGVSQSSPFGTPVTSNATSGSPSDTVTSANREIVLDVLSYVNASLTATANTTQSPYWSISSDGTWRGAGSVVVSGATSVLTSWTVPAGGYAHIAVSIKPA